MLYHVTVVFACRLQVYSIFTSFVVQDERTVLILAATVEFGASMEIMELLLKRGAAPSINNKDKVSQFRFDLKC
jgi:hypothetical protein